MNTAGTNQTKNNESPEMICTCCKKPSGYTDKDFVNIKPPRDINCKNCGKVCIKLRSSF